MWGKVLCLFFHIDVCVQKPYLKCGTFPEVNSLQVGPKSFTLVIIFLALFITCVLFKKIIIRGKYHRGHVYLYCR